MKNRKVQIIIYVIIVGVSLFLDYKFYERIITPGGDHFMNYALFIAFILFTYVNLKKLIGLFRKT